MLNVCYATHLIIGVYLPVVVMCSSPITLVIRCIAGYSDSNVQGRGQSHTILRELVRAIYPGQSEQCACQ